MDDRTEDEVLAAARRLSADAVRVLGFVVEARAAFRLQIAKATRMCPDDVSKTLDELIERNLVEFQRSCFNMPGHIFSTTEKGLRRMRELAESENGINLARPDVGNTGEKHETPTGA